MQLANNLTLFGFFYLLQNEAGTLPNLDLDLEDDFALVPNDGATLLASTLEGTLVAINAVSGEILWELDDEPVVRSPYDSSKPVLPAFLPDPKDGSIYMIGRGMKEPLKKLPFTIPELVSASPCKSSDGILYTGKKVDTWFSVDRFTGSKQGSLTFNGCIEGKDNSCPNLGPSNFLVGRTEYNIMMYDSRAEGRKWNISYFDYTSNIPASDASKQHDPSIAYFTDSSTGKLVKLDKLSGQVNWQSEIGSPIVALFRVEGDGIVNSPFTSVSIETLKNLVEHFETNEPHEEKSGTKFFAALYVGEHEHGLYALPSLVDEQTLTIAPAANGPLLLEGPKKLMKDSDEISLSGIKDIKDTKADFEDPYALPLDMEPGTVSDKDSVLLFGFYQVPQHSTIKISPAHAPMQITSSNSHSNMHMNMNPNGQKIWPPFMPDLYPPPDTVPNRVPRIGPPNYNESPRTKKEIKSVDYDEEILQNGFEAIKSFNLSFFGSKKGLNFFKELIKFVNVNIGTVEDKTGKLTLLILFVIAYIGYRILQKENPFRGVYGSYRMSSNSIGSNGSHSGRIEVTALPIELENGDIKVGNIIFDPFNILGKGCEGTFVYK